MEGRRDYNLRYTSPPPGPPLPSQEPNRKEEIYIQKADSKEKLHPGTSQKRETTSRCLTGRRNGIHETHRKEKVHPGT
jgi:hypothetical protein